MPTPVPAVPDAKLRALPAPEGHIRLYAGDTAFAARGRASLDPATGHPSPLELLIGALAADLVAGFARHAHRAGMTVHDCELRLEGRLDNPLVALGVVGENGTPAVRSVAGSFYVSGEPGQEPLATLWEYTLAQSTVYATLARSVELEIQLVPQA